VISLASFRQQRSSGAKSKYPAMGVSIRCTHAAHWHRRLFRVLDHRGIRAADDMVVMPLQCGTQWDGLGHVFYENSNVERLRLREVTSNGAQKCGIERPRRGWSPRRVPRRAARLGKEVPETATRSRAPTRQDAEMQGLKTKRGDFVIVRTGQMEAKLRGRQLGRLSGGDAPGFAFETLEWIRRTELAALASDTWGCRCGRTKPRPAQPTLALDHDSVMG